MRKHFIVLLWLAFANLVVLFALVPYDYAFTKYATEHRNDTALTDFFNYNIYEHNIFGIADIVVLFFLGSLFLYGLSFIQYFSKIKKLRRGLGFILNAGVTVALSIVHAWKWAFSRVRPYDVFDNFPEGYTHWFLPGQYTLELGFNQGSFPSGHVATIASMMVLFFLIPHRQKFWRWAFALLIFILSTYMIWLRTAVRQHWITDNVASYGIALVVIYFFYYFIHYPPKENATKVVESRSSGWEFYLTLLNLIWLFAFAAIPVGLRLLFIENKMMGLGVLLGGIFSSFYLFDIIWNLLYQKKPIRQFIKKIRKS